MTRGRYDDDGTANGASTLWIKGCRVSIAVSARFRLDVRAVTGQKMAYNLMQECTCSKVSCPPPRCNLCCACEKFKPDSGGHSVNLNLVPTHEAQRFDRLSKIWPHQKIEHVGIGRHQSNTHMKRSTERWRGETVVCHRWHTAQCSRT